MSMLEFKFQLPTKVYFGENIVTEVLEQNREMLFKKAMIVTSGRSLIAHGYLKELQSILIGLLGKENLVIFDEISSNPKIEEIKRAVHIGRMQEVDVVLGFGGGSAIDAAKAVAVGIPAKEDLEEYLLKGKEPSNCTLPIIAIPTTAGTGSELSKAAIISSSQHQIKTGIRGKCILPQLAIIDVVYTWTVPLKTTMETGFDVLAHAIESYVAVKANMFSEMLSETAIQIVGENLIRLKKNLSDHEARKKMCYASMLMGINLANVGTCLPHRMQYAIGAVTDTSHAAGLLALYPGWIEQEYKVNERKIKKVMSLLGISEPKSPIQARRYFMDFLLEIDSLYNLEDLGIQKKILDVLPIKVTGDLSNDLLGTRIDILKQLFREAMRKE